MDAIHALFRPHRSFRATLPTLLLTALTLTTLGLLFPAQSYAVDYEGYDGVSDITLEQAIATADVQKEHFDALGLVIDQGIVDDMQAPYPEGKATDIFTKREVYVAANGNNANVYTMRDDLDTLGTPDQSKKSVKKETDVYDDYGQLRGGYDFYQVSNTTPKSSKGGSVKSYLSTNVALKPRGGFLHKAKADFSGKYATSVAYSAKAGSEAKQDHVAELRALGSKSSTTLNNVSYAGGIEVALFRIEQDGTRTSVGTLNPSINESQMCNATSSKSGTSNEFKYLDAGYAQEYDAYFELESGDVDGDGLDELFVYAGAYRDEGLRRLAIVDMFKTTDGQSYTRYSVEVDAGSSPQYPTGDDFKRYKPDKKNHDDVSNFWRWQLLKTAPVVTIAVGDLDRNGNDEVALAVSAPSTHNSVAEPACCHIFNWNGTDLKSANIGEEGKGEVSLYVKDTDVATSASPKDSAMVSANCTFGTFLVPETSYYTTALLIAGYQTTGTSSGSNDAYTRFGYRYVYYDIEDACVKVSEYRTHALGPDGTRIAKSAVSKASKDRRYKPTLAPLALATARLESFDEAASMSDHVLAGGDIYGFNMRTGLSASELGSMSLTMSQYNQNGHDKSKDQVWIGDVVSGIVAHDELAHESFLGVVGVHRDEDLRGSDDYYWMDISHFTFDLGKSSSPSTGQEGVVCESVRASSRTYGVYTSLCLPDIDNDSIRIRFVGKDLVVSAPEVLAILQDSPTFAELDELYGYVSGGSTSFGKTDTHGNSNAIYIDGAGGLQFDGQVALIVKGKLTVSAQIAGGYQYQWTNSTSYGITYSAQAGKGNKAVVYSTPSVYYKYQYFDPDKKTWEDYIVTMKAEPVTSVISVDTWNKVAEDTTSLFPIDSSVLSNVSGDPFSYQGGMAGTTIPSDKQFHTMTTSTKSPGATTDDSITSSWGDSHDFHIGAQACVNFAIGGGFLKEEATLGPIINFDFGYEHTWIHTKDTYFGGGVDNLPLLDNLVNAAGNYAFSWKLIVNQLDKEIGPDGKKVKKFGDAYLIGYEVKDVHKPKLGQVGNARVSQATENSVTLSWVKTDFGQGANDANSAYAIGMLSANGSDVATWRYAHINDTSYTWEGLNPSTPYQFVMRAVQGSWAGEVFNPTMSSIPTQTITGATLAHGEQCSIQPLRMVSPANGPVSAGESAVFETEATWSELDGSSKTRNKSESIYYLWQKKDPGSSDWVSIAQGYGTCDLTYDLTTTSVIEDAPKANASGTPDLTPRLVMAPEAPSDAQGSGSNDAAASSVSRLTVTGASLVNDGTLFRCSVGFSNQRMLTGTATLHVEAPMPASVSGGFDVGKIGPSMHAGARVFVQTADGSVITDNQEEEHNGNDGSDNDNGNNKIQPNHQPNTQPSNQDANPATPASAKTSQTPRATASTSDCLSMAPALLAISALALLLKAARKRKQLP